MIFVLVLVVLAVMVALLSEYPQKRWVAGVTLAVAWVAAYALLFKM